MSGPLACQCLLGIQCNNFVMIAGDQTSTMSIFVIKHDEEKLHNISEKHLMGIVGDSGDRGQFTQFVAKNLQLYKLKNGYQLHTAAVAHFVRKNLIDALKGSPPSMVNMLLGGYDDDLGGQLYTVDFLASSMRVPFGGHGFGGLITMSILDRHHSPTLTEPQAYDILKLCIREIQHRLFISLPNFTVKVVNKNGITALPNITPATFMQLA